MNRSKYNLFLTVAFISILVGASTLVIGLNVGYSWTGTQNTLSPGYIEFEEVNGSSYYLDDTQVLIRHAGATAYVGFNESLAVAENYWLCDGTGDSTPINAALSYLNSSGGGQLLAEIGTYGIDAPLNIIDRVRVIGEQTHAVWFDLQADCNMWEYTGTGNLTWFTLEKMTCDGNKAARASGTGFHFAPTGAGSGGDFVIKNVFFYMFKQHGIYTTDGWGWRLDHVISEYNDGDGLRTNGGSYLTIINSKIGVNTGYGVYNDGHGALQLYHNEIFSNGEDGVYLVNAQVDPRIIDNFFWSNTGDGVEVGAGGVSRAEIKGNKFQGNGGYGVNLSGGSGTSVLDNEYNGNTSGALNDDGAARIHSVQAPFVQGTTLVSAAGGPKGWEIDLAGEYAISFLAIPRDVQEVQRIMIFGIGLAAPGAGNQMHLEIDINAGAKNETWNAEEIALTNWDTQQTNPAVNATISWRITPAHDSDVDDLTWSDLVEIKVLFEAGAAGDADTDAVLLVVVFYYV